MGLNVPNGFVGDIEGGAGQKFKRIRRVTRSLTYASRQHITPLYIYDEGRADPVCSCAVRIPIRFPHMASCAESTLSSFSSSFTKGGLSQKIAPTELKKARLESHSVSF